MTKKDLSQLYYLRREIEDDRRRLARLEGRNGLSIAAQAEMADLRAIIQAKNEMCVARYNQIMRYVAGIEDSMMRQIIIFRHADMMTWREIAQRIGGGNTEDSIRKAYARFLEQE